MKTYAQMFNTTEAAETMYKYVPEPSIEEDQNEENEENKVEGEPELSEIEKESIDESVR